MGVKVLNKHLTEDEQAHIEYLRDLIRKAVPDSDTFMVVSAESWANHLTWALDKLEAVV